MPRFDVFGKLIEVSRGREGWKVMYVGSQGKHCTARDVVIPESVSEAELDQYLADFFHQFATPEKSEVRRIDS